MEEELEIINPKKINYKKYIAVFFALFLFSLVLFFGLKALNLTKKIIVAKSSKVSPYLNQGVDFINDISSNSIIKEEDRRINILLLGHGGGFHDGPNLTDTIIIASIDPLNKKVAMLSIPRDLQVKVDGFGYYKINSIYNLSESYYDNEQERIQLLKDTIENVIGVPIHYLAMIDFNGFKSIIDILEGIEVEVGEDIYDPYYPDENLAGYDEFIISKGIHLMDGETALKYARSRKTTSDFDRARRQQDILVAVKNKFLSRENIFNIRKISQISETLSENIKTDLQISEIESLIKILKQVDNKNISTKVIDDDIDGLVYADRIDEMYVLLPYDNDYKEIHEFVRQYFKDPFIILENARISVKNGTKENGAAKILADELISFGYNIVDISNTEERDYKNTFIYDYSNNDKKYSVDFLKKKLGDIPVIKLDEKDKEWDIEIIVGKDYKNKF